MISELARSPVVSVCAPMPSSTSHTCLSANLGGLEAAKKGTRCNCPSDGFLPCNHLDDRPAQKVYRLNAHHVQGRDAGSFHLRLLISSILLIFPRPLGEARNSTASHPRHKPALAEDKYRFPIRYAQATTHLRFPNFACFEVQGIRDET